MTLALSDPIRAAIVAHARKTTPYECCGILGGLDGEVDTVYRCTNISPDPCRSFVVSPEEQRVAFEAILTRGEDLLGFYHSHPASAPDLSVSDRAHAYYHGVAIVIVSLATDPPQIAVHDLEAS